MFRSSKKPPKSPANKTSQITAGDPPDNARARRVVRGDDSPTVPLDPPPGPAGAIDPAEAATRLLHHSDDDTGTLADPPVAILLIIAGPGKGHLAPVGFGMNPLGRGPDQRVRLDFGDERISRSAHAALTYDGDGKRFYLRHGGGASLTYHNGAPVLEPVEIADGARIRLGETELLFRTLVGPDFDWVTATS